MPINKTLTAIEKMKARINFDEINCHNHCECFRKTFAMLNGFVINELRRAFKETIPKHSFCLCKQEHILDCHEGWNECRDLVVSSQREYLRKNFPSKFTQG